MEGQLSASFKLKTQPNKWDGATQNYISALGHTWWRVGKILFFSKIKNNTASAFLVHFWLIHGIGALVSGAIAHQQNCDFLLERKCWDWAAPNPQICAGPVKSTEFFFSIQSRIYRYTTYGRYLHKKRDKFFTKKFGDLQVKSFDPFWVSPSVLRR